MTEISKEYGTALYMLACEEGVAKEYAEVLQDVKEIFESSPQYLLMLSSPSIPLVERLSAIDKAFLGKVPEHIVSYLKLLTETNRIEHLISSIEEYKALLNASEKVYSAKVTSAQELSEEEKSNLIKKLSKVKGGRIEAEYLVDEKLIGGVIVEIEGTVMDGSLRRRLQQVKEVIK